MSTLKRCSFLLERIPQRKCDCNNYKIPAVSSVEASPKKNRSAHRGCEAVRLPPILYELCHLAFFETVEEREGPAPYKQENRIGNERDYGKGERWDAMIDKDAPQDHTY